MNIKEFSLRTGIPDSTLRYYEKKKLLIPERHERNGYRLYQVEQIEVAKRIASLRNADISIEAIQAYFQANTNEQAAMKDEWIMTLKQKRAQLDLSIRYLESNQNKEEIFLFEKEAENIIWFDAEEPPGEFKEVMLQKGEHLQQKGFRIQNMYLETVSATSRLVKAKIGFAIKGSINKQDLTEGKWVEDPAVFCVGLSFDGDFSKVVSAYRKLYGYCLDNNWIPAAPVFEWYRGSELGKMDLVMPIIKIEGG